MWHLDTELEAWFDDVRRRHDSQRTRPGDVEDAPMVTNDLAPR